ncbi:MAG: type II toxin-antitoxin system RelE/ParE family toxin [Nitrosopumilus sp.]
MTLVYTLKYSKTAAKDFQKLDVLVKRRIREAIETKLVKDPLSASMKLRDFEIKGVRRFRVGNYRVFIFISSRVIEVLRVGHRREIYK